MSNEYGFFASKEHDRRYSADDFSAFFGDFFTNGVLGSDTNSLKVSAVGDMNISIASGTAYINGHWFRRKSAQVLALADSDKVYGRIDAAVIRCDLEKRMVYPFIIEGIPASAPAQPSPVRDEKCYDIVLAYIKVAANCVAVTAADIADKRGDGDVCGFVTSAIDHIDTTGLFEQYDAQWELLKAGCAKDSAAVIKAWSALNALKTINGTEPTNGNIVLTQGLIPSGDNAYQMPYYIQSGTVTVTSSMRTGTSITFPKAFTSTPLLALTASFNLVSGGGNNPAPQVLGYSNLTATGFTLYPFGFSTSGEKYLANAMTGTARWFAMGKV